MLLALLAHLIADTVVETLWPFLPVETIDPNTGHLFLQQSS